MKFREFLAKWNDWDHYQVADFSLRPDSNRRRGGGIQSNDDQYWFAECSVYWASGWPSVSQNVMGHTLQTKSPDVTIEALLDELNLALDGAVARGRALADASLGVPKKPILSILVGAGFSAGFGLPTTLQLAGHLSVPCPHYSENWWTASASSYRDAIAHSMLSTFGSGAGKIDNVEAFLSMWEGEREQWDQTGRSHGAPSYYKSFLENMASWFTYWSQEAEYTAGNEERFAAVATWLARAANRFDVRFITFNYDLIAERLCRRAGIAYSYLDSPTDTETVKIRKLHGSANFSHSINFESVYLVDDQVTASRNLDEPPFDWGGKPPILMPPMANKVYGGFLDWIWCFASQDVVAAEKVLFIGYSFPQLDVVARQRLGNTLASRGKPLSYVLPTSVRDQVLRSLPGIEIDWWGERWTVDHLNRLLET